MFTTLVLFASYGVILLNVLHGLSGNWSGIATLGNFAALVLSIPFLLVRAWQLQPAIARSEYSPWKWWSSLMFPLLFLGFWVIATVVSR